jgi:hypothetical protein
MTKVEDMRRRQGQHDKDSSLFSQQALLFCSIPLLGHCAYLVLRPPIIDAIEADTTD